MIKSSNRKQAADIRDKARANREQFYSTGFPCIHGHNSVRYSKNGQCVECSRAYSLKYQKDNKEYAANRNKESRKRHLAKRKSEVRRWYRRNKHKNAAKQAARRAYLLQATPKWADLKAIESIYAESRRLSRKTRKRHEVDHIIPLRGKNVCGLHVENNLQILTKKENRIKSNKFECNN